MNSIYDAREFAKKAHKGKLYNGKSYYTHPIQVYKIITLLLPFDYELQAAAILHDVLEEGVTYERLAKKFGPGIADLVNEVTKTKYNTFPRLKSRRGVILKYADRLSNLVNMNLKDEAWQEKYIQKSRFWK